MKRKVRSQQESCQNCSETSKLLRSSQLVANGLSIHWWALTPITTANFRFHHDRSACPVTHFALENQVQLDLRILKYFVVGEHGKLDLVAESFNLLNHTNAVALNHVFGPGADPISTYNTTDRASLARQFQFSMDFEF